MSLILVIDDDTNFRSMLKAMLEREEYEVKEACNGKDGINLFKKTLPDLTITDIVMPEKEGIETIRELRQHAPDAKIIAISGGGQLEAQDYLFLAKKFGAACTLAKPFKREVLLAEVNNLLSQD